ncbi:MAG TPA: TonB-dependent receptor, partial [Bacteroidota bacterium]|nr:TonB-dependent receptor [Bacteroidota bacterium]
MKAIRCLPVLLTLLLSASLFAGTTGKIAGTVTDARSGEKLLSVNVVVEGLATGAATNINGFYAIVNILPGTYRVKASLVGYTTVTQVDVRVELDQTTTLNFTMNEETVQGQEVVIVAQRPVVQKDISASRTNLTIAEVDKLPVTTVSSAVSLQAGIENSATGPVIRGSSPDQSALMVDGLTMRDERTNLPYTGVALSAIEDIQVQTGGFNAEYGNLRSGVVNVITKEGGKSDYSIAFNGRYANPRPKHFGPSIYDKNSYWIRPYVDPSVCWTGTQNGAWDAATQQQYAQFQGWNA